MERINFHTHTRLCKHADGIPVDYCREAVKQGVSLLGFSDHTPYKVKRWETVRMDFEQLPQYVSWIKEAKAEFPELKILQGMECEWDPNCVSYFQDVLQGEYGCQYLIGAAHSYIMDGGWKGLYGSQMTDRELHAYTDYAIQGINSGIYLFFAHPDVFGVSYLGWNDEATACCRAICEAAAAAGLPLEVNGYGLRKKTIEDHGSQRHMYPLVKFWEIAGECGVKAVVSSDAHRPQDVWNNTDDCTALAERFGVPVVNEELAKCFL